MATEVTTENTAAAGGKKAKARGGQPNPAVDQAAASLSASTVDVAVVDPVVERVLSEAKENLSEDVGPAAVTRQEQPPTPAQPEEPPEEFNPFTRAPQADPPPLSPKARKEEQAALREARPQSPATKRVGPLGKKLPGAEHAKVHKRKENGSLAYIGEYTNNDMVQSQDIESFLHKYIKPKYGAGEYVLTAVDGHGREYDMGSIQLEAELSADVMQAANKAPDIAQQMLTEMTRRHEAEMTAYRATIGQQKDPFETVTQALDLTQRLMPKQAPAAAAAPAKNNDVAIAIVGGITQIAGTLLAIALKPKEPDPLMQILLTKLLADDKPSGGMGALPPMPPAADPTEQLKNLAAVIVSLRGDGGGGSKDDRLVDYLLKDRMGPEQVLALVNQVKGERGTDDFKKTMENMGFLLNAVQQVKQQTEVGGGTGIMDGIVALLGNKELTSTLAARMRGGPAPQQRALPPQQQQPDPLMLKARENAAKRLLIEEQELALREKALAQHGVLITPPAPKMAPNATPAAAPQQVAAAPQPTAATPAQPSAPPPQVDSQAVLPEHIADFINRYIEAKDDADIVQITLEMMESMAGEEQWREHAVVLADFLMKSDRTGFLSFISKFYIVLRDLKLIEEDLARKIMNALASNFERLVTELQERAANANADAPDEGNGDPDDLLQLEGTGEEGDEDDGEGDDADDDDEQNEPH